MSDKSFAQLFCDGFNVTPDRFVDEAMKRTYYSHARLIMLSLNACFRLRWLEADREILTDLGSTTNLEDMKRLLSLIPSYYDRNWNFRQRLRLRISSRKVINLATRLGLTNPRKSSARGQQSVRLIEEGKPKGSRLDQDALHA
jgi:hypothetical protein